jgi:glycine hydroxymethyltransferase
MALKEKDPEIFSLIEKEQNRQDNGLELIASENFTTPEVMEALGSCLTNKYSEGQPGRRYYGGNEFIDEIELLCKKRALETFRLKDDEWGVNVQAYSGSPANFAVFTAVLEPYDRLMGLDLPSGGHLSHGYYTASGKKISAVSKYFTSLPYTLNKETELIDYDELEKTALVFRPKIIIGGASAYPREINWKRLREICNKCGALLLADISHISGLVCTQEHMNPFEYVDILTTTTHKTLRGPRSALIFHKKSLDIGEKIDSAVFPGLQGGPHNHQIAAVAVALKSALHPEFKEYIQHVKKNAKQLASTFMDKGYKLMTNGTDNHLILLNVREKGITGSKIEKVLDLIGVTVNKNTILGDKNALVPGGIRIGTPACTSRGMREKEFEEIGEIIHEGIQFSLKLQEKVGKKMVDFVKGCEDQEEKQELDEMRKRVLELAKKFT